MENNSWDQKKIQDFIDNEVEENLTLDYKRAAALSKNNKNEITKDVSAMANSAGGVIVYGVAEYTEQVKKHLPERIDPVDRNLVSKEWLEHVIGNIQPKIPNLAIYPVPLSSGINDCVYVVEIPKGSTAHQASSKKFYKRYNFESVEMDYHEVIDVMGRKSTPKIVVEFEMEFETHIYRGTNAMYQDLGRQTSHSSKLIVRAINEGGVYAKYINLVLKIPSILFDKRTRDEGEFTTWIRQNTKRDVIGTEGSYPHFRTNYGSSWYAPVLPGRNHIWEIDLSDNADELIEESMVINWEVFADNALPNSGSKLISEITKTNPVVDTYSKDE